MDATIGDETMTANELHSYFNRIFGMNEQWPETFEVDAATYGNCCQDIFNDYIGKVDDSITLDIQTKNVMVLMPTVRLGKNGGLMFRNVELILKP